MEDHAGENRKQEIFDQMNDTITHQENERSLSFQYDRPGSWRAVYVATDMQRLPVASINKCSVLEKRSGEFVHMQKWCVTFYADVAPFYAATLKEARSVCKLLWDQTYKWILYPNG